MDEIKKLLAERNALLEQQNKIGSSTRRVEFKPRHCTLTASALLFTGTSQMGV